MTPFLYSLFLTASIQYQISLNTLIGICSVESDFDIGSINYNDGGLDAHSFGICQVQYTTARDMGYKLDSKCVGEHINKCGLLKPEINISLAAKYFKYQLDRYGNEKRAISAYNAGHAIKSNKRYVDKVILRSIE